MSRFRRSHRAVSSGLAVLVAGGILTACGGGSSGGGTSSAGGYNPNGVLTYAFDMSEGQFIFDPAKTTGSQYENSTVLGQLLQDSLLRAQPDGSLTPELATSAKVVNSETIAVTLRPGVKFQDGNPLTADAVKDAIMRNAASTSVAFPAQIHDVSAVTTSGQLNLTIHLSKPDAGAFYPLLAGLTTMPYDPAAIQKGDNDPITNPIGAGPFRVKAYTPGQSLTLTKNPAYWNAGKIKLGGIEFVNESASGPAEINALKAGTVDVITSDITQLDALNGGGIKTSVASGDTSKLYFPICASRGPLQNVQVRQALNYGLDKKAISQALAGGEGEPASALVPKSSNLFPSNLANSYAYNPTKAKQLLAAAGYAKGLTLTIIPEPLPITQSLAEIAQQDWKKIGVNLEIKNSSNFVQDVFINHVADMTTTSVIRGGLEALSFEFTPGHLGNLCNYSNPTLTAMINKLSALPPTDPQYVTLWKRAQEFVVDNALQIWGVWLPAVVAYNSNKVGGIRTVFPQVTAYPDFFTAYVK